MKMGRSDCINVNYKHSRPCCGMIFRATHVSTQYLVEEYASSDAHLRMRTPLTPIY